MPKKVKTKRVMRTPNNPFESSKDTEYTPLRIVARRLQEIQAGPNKGKNGEHFRVVWEGFSQEKDETWEPIENLYGHEHLVNDYEVWLKAHNLELDKKDAQEKVAKRKADVESRETAAQNEQQPVKKNDMPAIETQTTRTVKNVDGTLTVTQEDVNILQWWRDVGQAQFPRIAVMARQFLAIPASSATSERVFSFAGLTLSDLRKSLLDGTLEAIMWAKWGPPNIPSGRGDLHETNPELCD